MTGQRAPTGSRQSKRSCAANACSGRPDGAVRRRHWPGEDQSPTLVYSRCATQTLSQRRGCDLYRYSLDAGSESKLAGANSAHASEIAPTIWRGRIAWARISDTAKTRRPPIYTRALGASASTRSRRLRRFRLASAAVTVAGSTSWSCEGGGWRSSTATPGPSAATARSCSVRLEGASSNCQHDLWSERPDVRRALLRRPQPLLRPLCASGCGQQLVGGFRYSLRSRRYSLAHFGRRLTGFSYDSGGRRSKSWRPTPQARVTAAIRSRRHRSPRRRPPARSS